LAILVATLIDDAQLQSDKRNDGQLASADWVKMVNWAVKSLYRLLTSLDPDAYFDQQDFTLAGGVGGNTFDLKTLTGTGSLPHTFRALHGVDFRPDTTGRRTVTRRNFQERNQGAIGWWLPGQPCTDRKYDLRAKILNITPYEVAAGTYRVYYRYAPYLFTGSADTNPLDAELEEYDEYIGVMAAMKALGIEESSQDPLAQRLGVLVQEITDEHERDDESPAVIADVEDNDDGWNPSGPW
jgi:hypothetical protein